jgi:prolyl-tRNA editing enzyme YbaK/EbsC (Cys-tRNA(Pro) deacylase)
MSAVDRFRAAAGPIEVRRTDASTRTAEDAARAIGCEVGQIVKSLVWIAGDEPVLALVGGDRRLDPARLGSALGAEQVRQATPDEVRRATGFAIGGVPPFGHATPLRSVMDSGLARHATVWAAAGTPRDVFPIAPEELAARASAGVHPLAEP